jgi:hypothetical protein
VKRRAFAALAATLVAAVAAGPSQATRKPRIRTEAAPAWLVEAARTTAPASAADVAWLLVDTRVEPLAEGGVRVTHRSVGQVLRPEGLDVLGDLDLLYREDDRVERLAAWVRQEDGTWRVPIPDDDLQDLPWSSAGSVHEDLRRRSLIVPGLRVSSVVGRERVVVHAIDAGAVDVLFGDATRPTVLERLVLRVPAGWGHGVVIERGDGLTLSEDESGRSVVAKDLAPLPPAELRPPVGRLLPRAWVLAVGAPRQDEARLELTLPEGWEPETLPEPLALRAAGLRGDVRWTLEGRTLRVVQRSTLEVSEVSPSGYPDFREAVRTLDAATGRPVVLVRAALGGAGPETR